MGAFFFVFTTVTLSVILIGAVIGWLDKCASRRDQSEDS